MENEERDLQIAYAAILTMACIPIYIGAHMSLNQKEVESMSSEDAWKFPIIGSGVLFGLYMLFKMFSKEYINMLLTSYFVIFGVLAVKSSIKPIVELFVKKQTKKYSFSFTPFWRRSGGVEEISFDNADIISMIAAVAVGVWYAFTKHWIANNILGFSFSVTGIALLALGSYKVGCILLGGLFFYDIFWVFGTDVMVTVAKSFDAPIKLLFPKSLFAEELQFSMLGLGDIVIPGVFIALLLRFDAKRSADKKKKKAQDSSRTASAAIRALKKKNASGSIFANFSKPYFNVCFISYILGLGTTIFVMHTFKAAQPALLYLVPACIGSSLLFAVYRGEVKQLFDYVDEAEQNKQQQQQQQQKQEANKQN